MSNDFINPDKNGFKSKVLDEYLALGYYRMRNNLFTTHQVFIEYYGNSAVYTPVFWIRTILGKLEESVSSKRIRKKCIDFSVCFKSAEITEETEELFSEYKKMINFETYDSLRDCMMENEATINPFNSMMIEIRDRKELIAVGYFDIGETSSMAILNYYHPNYKKYSLGKFLLLKTLDYSKEQNMLYFYPGYISTTETKMDYKIFPSKNSIEVFLAVEKTWKPLLNYTKKDLHDYFFKRILNIDFDENDLSVE